MPHSGPPTEGRDRGERRHSLPPPTYTNSLSLLHTHTNIMTLVIKQIVMMLYIALPNLPDESHSEQLSALLGLQLTRNCRSYQLMLQAQCAGERPLARAQRAGVHRRWWIWKRDS